MTDKPLWRPLAVVSMLNQSGGILLLSPADRHLFPAVAFLERRGCLRVKRHSNAHTSCNIKIFFPESWNPSGKRCDLTQVGPDDQHERNFVRKHWRRGIPYPRTGSSQSFARLYSTYIISHFPAAVQDQGALNTKIYHEDPMTWCEGYFFPEHNLLS